MAVKEFDVRIVATGAHLSPEFGLTYKEIEQDGFTIDRKIEMLLSSDSPAAVSKSMGLAMIGFADYFQSVKPDWLMVLGDRYETLSVAMAAMNQQIPIAHLYGGETTQGAIDEAVRHAITKLSYLHFTCTEISRKRVIQLGEHPSRVHCVGAIGVENILKEPLLSKKILAKSLGMTLVRPYAVVTFHPVTLEKKDPLDQITALLEVMTTYPDMDFIITKANADVRGRIINEQIEEYAHQTPHLYAFDSLGMVRYLSCLKYSTMVIGNSSSGIAEAPSFGIPTVNIGDRQKGRELASSIINCEPRKEAIVNAINQALDPSFIEVAKKTVNLYGSGDTSGQIVKVIQDAARDVVDLKKQFYDWPETQD